MHALNFGHHHRVWAWVVSLNDPFQYFADQTPDHLKADIYFPPQALAVTLQLSNVLLLLAAMAVICCFSTSSATARWYLIAVAFADYGHIYSVCRAVDSAVLYDFSQWNEMMVGNIGVSAVLNVLRWLTVLGVFGGLGASGKGQAKKQV